MDIEFFTNVIWYASGGYCVLLHRFLQLVGVAIVYAIIPVGVLSTPYWQVSGVLD